MTNNLPTGVAHSAKNAVKQQVINKMNLGVILWVIIRVADRRVKLSRRIDLASQFGVASSPIRDNDSLAVGSTLRMSALWNR